METTYEQMVYAEATTVVPLIFSYVYHNTDLKKRRKYEWAKMLDTSSDLA
ncbi:MAG: deoxyhypusine synthase-like protein [Methanomassiliicoccales archaeon PtaU1.Bin030]|nr:MAG: deoxyhypusine synthase-like protein [Methanomassiliicoccales archaeon PtaU1.Bin030]